MKTKTEYPEISSELIVTKRNLIAFFVVLIGILVVCGGFVFYLIQSTAKDRTILDTRAVGRILDAQIANLASLVKTEQGNYSIYGYISYDNDATYVIHSFKSGESLLCPDGAWVFKDAWETFVMNPACYELITPR